MMWTLFQDIVVPITLTAGVLGLTVFLLVGLYSLSRDILK